MQRVHHRDRDTTLTQAVRCLLLGPETPEVVPLLESAAAAQRITLELIPAPRDYDVILDALYQSSASLLLASDSPAANLARTGVGSVYFPPLLIVSAEATSVRAQQSARIFGASAVIRRDAPAALLGGLIRRLLALRNSKKTSIERKGLRSALEILAMGDRSAMFTVACPHCAPVSASAWDTPNAMCERGGSNEHCSGWYGRIYVQHGKIVHAEVPGGSRGREALLTMATLRHGELIAHETFIRPDIGTMSDPISEVLGEIEPQIPRSPSQALKLPVAEPLSSSPTSDTMPKSTASLTCSELFRSVPGLRGVARSDGRGWVKELAGEIDAETTCAMASMSAPGLNRIGSLLGLGEVDRWSIAGTNAIFHGATAGGEIVAALSSTDGNLLSQNEKLGSVLRGRG